MTEAWRRVSALFDEAVGLDAAGRERLLAREESQHPQLVSEVRALLRAHEQSGEFLEQPAWVGAPELLAESLDAPLTGRRIGPYQVREEVGRGGMGVVYAAEDERLGRVVALKMLPAAFSRDARARERLAREARAAAALSHPCIATVFALEEIDGDLFIATELVRGTTLRAELAAGPLPPDRLLHTMTCIADALDAAHRHGIVHRDLKPENVLRAEDGGVKVVDFGIARTTGPLPATQSFLTLAGARLGTPAYMAPEQLRGETVDARADIFSFGVMAYELATGSHPFGGSDPAALVERLVSDDQPLSRPVEPAALDAVIRHCLRADPSARYQSGTELAAELRSLGQAPSRVTPRAAPLQAAWWWQFHQVAVAVLTILATATVGIRRGWIGPYGSWIFLAVLVLATITTTLRLHMWFVSQVHPATLGLLRARVLRWVVVCEALLLALLLGIGIYVAGPHDGTAAQLVVIALLLLLSLIVIEPATTRASLNN
jgi:hypothetical protein